MNKLVSVSGMDISVVSGGEVKIFSSVDELVKSDEFYTLNNTRYAIIEFPTERRIINIFKVISDILVKGLIPIIANPERYSYIQSNIKEAIKYVESGALLQLNITSLVGDYGDEVKKTAIKLLKHNLIHLIGSDFHNYKKTYDCNRVDDSFEVLKEIVGEEKFVRITETNIEYVMADKDVETFDIKYGIGLFS